MAGSKDVGNIKSISGSLSSAFSCVVSFSPTRSPYKMATLSSYPLSLVMPSRKRKSVMTGPVKVLGVILSRMSSFCASLQMPVDKGLDSIGWIWIMFSCSWWEKKSKDGGGEGWEEGV